VKASTAAITSAGSSESSKMRSLTSISNRTPIAAESFNPRHSESTWGLRVERLTQIGIRLDRRSNAGRPELET
jgi:hypothetical protein